MLAGPRAHWASHCRGNKPARARTRSRSSQTLSGSDVHWPAASNSNPPLHDTHAPAVSPHALHAVLSTLAAQQTPPRHAASSRHWSCSEQDAPATTCPRRPRSAPRPAAPPPTSTASTVVATPHAACQNARPPGLRAGPGESELYRTIAQRQRRPCLLGFLLV